MKINDLIKLCDKLASTYSDYDVTNIMCLKDGTYNVFLKKADTEKGLKIHSKESI